MKNKIKTLINLIRKERKVPIPIYLDNASLLKNKVALISGGSSGIGLAIAEAFIKSGAKVIIAGRSAEKLAIAKAKLNSANIKQLVLDVTDINSIPQKIEQAVSLFPENQIDILVNSAGAHHLSSFETMKEEEFDKIIATNIKGVFFLSRAIGLYMKEKQIQGNILHISSSSALRPAWGPYQMSKWAIKGFTVGLAEKLQPYGIVVNSLAPGQTATPMLGKDSDKIEDIHNNYAIAGRYIMPQEISNLAVFMVSDMGRMIVGDTFYVTGGSGLITYNG